VNLFEATDRYMILHYSGVDADAAAAMVGNYYSARVVPLLLTSLAALAGATLMPHLSHDWESGRREEVARKQRLALKMIGLGMFVGAATVQLAGPLLFDVILQGKYSSGRDVLPWVLAACIWAGMGAVAFNYLWCAERLRASSIVLGGACGLNIALNLVLLPKFGLLGAVLATAAAHFVQLAMTLLLSQSVGLKAGPGLWIVAASPVLLCLGPTAAAGGAIAVAWYIGFGPHGLSADERGRLADAWQTISRKIALINRRRSAPST
jgi:O-antigen/teichoic acid export membrane protein